jgi:SAM-dependent methyltransferase
MDLVTASQALHWFDFGLFFAEAKRVLKPSGLLAAWCYDVPEIPDIPREMMLDLYYGAMEPYWPPERKYVDARYQAIDFPFPEVQDRQFTMREFWNFHELAGYVSTWSASKEFVAANDRDQWENLLVPLRQRWGDPDNTRHIAWPVHMRSARMERVS